MKDLYRSVVQDRYVYIAVHPDVYNQVKDELNVPVFRRVGVLVQEVFGHTRTIARKVEGRRVL